MDQSSLTSLMVELFMAIRLVSGYPSPDGLPQIQRVSVAEMQQKICSGRSCAVKAFYHPEWGVYVDEALDIQNNAFDRSILLHELVHHVQAARGRFDAMPSACDRWNAAEREAYALQNLYLAGVHSARHVAMSGWVARCDGN